MSAVPSRELDLVELVDVAGRRSGSTTVAQAHAAPGLRHRAFSVLLLDPTGQRLLLQQRARAKTRFPLQWANSCCGHPAPGEPVALAAGNRLIDELGLTGVVLTEVGVYRYQAPDPDTGWVEHEYDHVLTGVLPPEQPVRPNPAEVAQLRWVDPPQLRELLAAGPSVCVPWLAGVIGPLATVVGRHWGG